jgi:hypothetical protein
MERAGRLIGKLGTARDALGADRLARAAWRAAVGVRIDARTRIAGLADDKLIVEVEDDVWRRNLHGLRRQILANLKDLLGEATPRGIEFRTGTPRRPPAREESVAAKAPVKAVQDEADRIADPVLRRIFLASRRKASA